MPTAGAVLIVRVDVGPHHLLGLDVAERLDSTGVEPTAGLVLTALPAGFALAATGGDRMLPRGLTDRGRCLAGVGAFTLSVAALLVVPLTIAGLVPVPVPAPAGLGLGIFTPANNTMIMGAIPARPSGTGDGLVNMTRGLGTAMGVALVTFALHLVGGGRQAGARWSAGVLVVASAVAVGAPWSSPGREPKAPQRMP
ncbi:hypothetical protein OG426_01755 [Streptomyces canus]|uniref:hypothetical protein n=1 Tax=Streptomyces canus TaxID=58343 RepID=UPI00386E1E31|nr:hypothetical protein OG426_01755 [Streptomyces canus]